MKPGKHPDQSAYLDTQINILHALMRYGEALSQSDLAAILGCSRMTIRRIELSAARKVVARLKPIL